MSTHRYLVESHPHFEPWCCESYTVTGEYLWLWGCLDNDKNMQGWSMQGTVKDHTIYCEWLSKMCFPTRVKKAKYSLVDFTMLAHNATAVQLQVRLCVHLLRVSRSFDCGTLSRAGIRCANRGERLWDAHCFPQWLRVLLRRGRVRLQRLHRLLVLVQLRRRHLGRIARERRALNRWKGDKANGPSRCIHYPASELYATATEKRGGLCIV